MTSYPPSTPERGSDPYAGMYPGAGEAAPGSGQEPWTRPGQAPGPQSAPVQPWAMAVPPQPLPDGQPWQQPSGRPPPLPENGKGTGALVCAILSIVLCCVPIISVVLAIAAIVLGVQGRRAAAGGTANNSGVATSGVVIGSVGVVVGALGSLIVIIGFAQV